ncbi:MAG: aminotransferase class I/II-fold pyridoxal phosphate-dependent enzyme [Leptolyngbyaceae cyanobacterium bins.349]|nr:aminotransferase class I/II-fold pyridoxal phosphate-dependent enzyme [Leptolyngbyaceae cyanobacterium bins.349]
MVLHPIAQHDTPLLTALQHCATRSTAPFHTPGHKRGAGIDAALRGLLGDRVFQADLPELPELDNLFAPSGVIQQAQDLAAQVFGAEETWFLTNGSTAGVIAAILATCQVGDKIILPRNVHQSAISGLVLSGAMPIWVTPEFDATWDLAHGVSVEAIAHALHQHPEAKAVMLVSPTYLGVCSDVAAIAHLCHQHAIPLLVDEAHGPHFGHHPDLPISALQAGADLAVQSTHKVLSALTQAAMVHVQGELLNRDRLAKSLALVQSTSPNYLLLASLDATRRQIALQGQAFMEHTLQLADAARSQLSQIPGLRLLEALDLPGSFAGDRTRLTVHVAELGVDGFTADELLSQQWGVVAELPTLRHLTFIISLGNTQEDIKRLVQSLEWLSQEAEKRSREPEYSGQKTKLTPSRPYASTPPPLYPSTPPSPHASTAPRPHSPTAPSVLSPRDAFFAAAETVPIHVAVNRISAELICPYPPGIPVLVPGELITEAAIAALQTVLRAGGILSGGASPDLTSVKVVKVGPTSTPSPPSIG